MQTIEDIIPISVYQNLRSICGLSSKLDEACKVGLPNSLYSVMIKEEEDIIGMGRVIGDGGCFCQVVDICVHPQHQGKGLGKIIMKNISHFIRNSLSIRRNLPQRQLLGVI